MEWSSAALITGKSGLLLLCLGWLVSVAIYSLTFIPVLTLTINYDSYHKWSLVLCCKRMIGKGISPYASVVY